MQIHGILCPEGLMSCNGICNLTVSLDGFFLQCTSGGFYKERNLIFFEEGFFLQITNASYDLLHF